MGMRERERERMRVRVREILGEMGFKRNVQGFE